MEIRTATVADSEAWANMRSALWPESQDEHLPEIAEYFAGTSSNMVEVFVLVGDGGDLAGFLELNLRDFVEGSASPRLPYVEAWFVAAPVRGQGNGRKLMLAAEQWALTHGYDEIASDTEVTNTDSIQAHTRVGFAETTRVVCFLKRLK